MVQFQKGTDLLTALNQLLDNVKGLGGLAKSNVTNIAGTTSSGNGGSIAISSVNELDLELSAFGSQFSKIISIQQPSFDPIPEIKSNDLITIKQVVANNLKKSSNPEIFGQLSAENQQVLRELGF